MWEGVGHNDSRQKPCTKGAIGDGGDLVRLVFVGDPILELVPGTGWLEKPSLLIDGAPLSSARRLVCGIVARGGKRGLRGFR